MKKCMFALFACMILLGCQSQADAQETGEQLGFRVDETVLVSAVSPADGSRQSLISEYTQVFLEDYYFGKGPDTVSRKNDVLTRKGAMQEAVTFAWECTAPNTGYTLAYATDPAFSDARTVQIDTPEYKAEGLFVASDYYWQVVTHTHQGDNYSPVFRFSTADTPRIIAFPNVVNVRDIGGYLTEDGKYRVKQGMVYRGGNLDAVTAEDMKLAVELYGIKTDLDLRSPTSETDNMLFADRSPLFHDVGYINLSGVSYSSALPFSLRMKEELEVFTQQEHYPIYIHCKVGRDRTGTLVFLLGALLGVPEEQLLADYELTYLTSYAYASGDMRGHDNMTQFLEAFKYRPGDTLQEKAENYCLGCGMTQDEINAIRSNLLIPVN